MAPGSRFACSPEGGAFASSGSAHTGALRLCVALASAWDSLHLHGDPTDLRTVRLTSKAMTAFECRAEALGFDSGSEAIWHGTMELSSNLPDRGVLMLQSGFRPRCEEESSIGGSASVVLLPGQDPQDFIQGEGELGLSAHSLDIFRLLQVFRLWEQRLELRNWPAPLLRHVDAMGRALTARVVAWWLVQTVLLDEECALGSLVVGGYFCPLGKFGRALHYGHYIFDPRVVQAVFADVRAAASSQGPDGHLAKTFNLLLAHWGFGPYRFPRGLYPLLEPLPTEAVWDARHLEKYPDVVSLRNLLEEHAEELLHDWRLFRSQARYEADAELAYPQLTHNGTWRQWNFYKTSSGWNESLCSGFPSLCRIIGDRLSTRSFGMPVLGPSQEEVSINELTP
ncbi:unnamed protein product, partial [Polarella glacialis]